MRVLAGLLLVVALVLLMGCETTPPPPPVESLRRPEARLMVPPPQLPAVAPQEDLYAADRQCSVKYVEEAGKLESLQGYVSTVLAKKRK